MLHELLGRVVIVASLALGGLAACDGGGSARAALIVQTLVEQDRALAYLRPELVATKYAEMASGLQPFLRGAASVYFRDLTRLDGAEAVPHTAATELTQLVGDLHLENVGANFDDAGMFLDCVDFDATVAGPPLWDVRRAALGVAVASPSAVAALARGYVDGLTDDDVPLRAGLGALADALLLKADDRRTTRDELSRYTTVVAGTRRMVRDARMLDVPPPFAATLPDALARYRATRRGGPGPDIAIRDAVMRLGTGVASQANLRFWVLPEDDRILELKEQRDPPFPLAALGRGPTADGAFDNASRVVAATHRLLASATAEPDLGHVAILGVAFQVRAVLRGRQSFEFTDVNAATEDAVAELARAIGRILAHAHRHTASADALATLVGSEARLAVYLDESASRDRGQLERDWLLFQAALRERGPLLGGAR